MVIMARQTENHQAGPSRIPIYPHGWREIVNASLEEKFSSMALGSLNTLITTDFVPSPEHIQFLLYLTLRPTSTIPPSTPISTLYKLLSLHSSWIGAITNSLPRCDAGKGDWLNWDYKRSEIHRSIYKLMRRGTDGVWRLLYTQISSREKRVVAGRKRSRKDVEYDDNEEEKDDEEGEEEEVQKELSEEGWLVLEWLVDVWERDRHQHTINDNDNEATSTKGKGKIGYSSFFLEQLPRPHDSTNTLQRSNASAPLSILRSAFVDPTNNPYGAVEKSRRQGTATRILYLLLDTVLYPNSPPFHAASFLSSVIHLYKHLSLEQVTNLHQSLLLSLSLSPSIEQSTTYRRALGHVYTLLIEDLAGVRQERSKERHKRAVRSRQRRQGGIEEKREEEEEDFGSQILDWPTQTHLLNILLLPVPSTRNSNSDSSTATKHSSNHKDQVDVDKACRMIYFKLILVNLILTRNNISNSETLVREWEKINVGNIWWNKFQESLTLSPISISMADGQEGEGAEDEGVIKMFKSFATLLKIRVKDIVQVKEEES